VQAIPEGPAAGSEDEVDETMMRQVLGRMYKDRDYLEKFLGETGACEQNRKTFVVCIWSRFPLAKFHF